MKTSTAILLVGAAGVVAFLMLRKQAAAPKPSGAAGAFAGLFEFGKWGYGEIWGDEDDDA